MLIDKQGRIVDPDKLPKGRAKREAALPPLTVRHTVGCIRADTAGR